MVHLKKRSEFQAVMAAGVIAKTPHFAMHRWQQTSSQALSEAMVCEVLAIGALIPKRWAKKAVTRNLVRRQVYEAGRECAEHLAPTAYVVRLRATFHSQHFVSASSQVLLQAVREELRQLFAKVSLK